MLLKSISLENIRSYNSQEIIFPEGSSLLSGDIGAGKSSVLLAAEFALFGISKGELSGESLLRNGKNEGAVELNFTVDNRDVKIRRTLKRQKDSVSQGTGYIEIDGKKKEATAVELKAEILDILGYPKEALNKKSLIYRYTVYTPQEEMKKILFDEKDHRLNTLRRVFNIDRYKRIAENAMVYVKKLKDDKKELKGQIFDMDEKENSFNDQREASSRIKESLLKLDMEMQENKSMIEGKKSALETHEKKLKLFSDVKSKLELSRSELKSKRSLSEQYSNEQAEIKDRINMLNDKLVELKSKRKESKIGEQIEQEIKKIDYYGSRIAEIEDRISSKEEELREKRNSHMNAKQRLEAASRRSDEIEHELVSKEELLKDIASKKELLGSLKLKISQKQEIKQEIEQLENRIQDMKDHLKELELNRNSSDKIKETITKMSECPVCLQQVNAFYKLRVIERERSNQDSISQKMKELMKDANQDIERLNHAKQEHDILLNHELELKKIEGELKNAGSADKETADMREKLKLLKDEIEELQKKAGDDEAAIVDALRKDIDDSRAMLKLVNEARFRHQESSFISRSIAEKERRLQEIDALSSKIEDEIESISENIAEMVSSIESIGDVESVYLSIKHDLDVLLKIDMDNRMKLSSLQKEDEMHERSMAVLAKEIEHKKRAKAEIERLNQMQSWIEEYFIKLMALIEKHMFSKVYHEFNSLFQDWFKVLVDDELLNIRLDYDFTPIAEQNGYTTEIENLSGGEKTSVALAYRLSLNKVINNMMGSIKTKDMIILDEPTDGFSADQLDKMREVLEQMETKQTIIVSHESKIESFVDNIIRIGKHEHISGVQ